MNKEIINAIKSTNTVDELKNIAMKKGYNLTDEEAKGYFNMYHTNGKVAENELDNVAGGSCYSSEEPYRLIVTDFNHCKAFEYDSEYKNMSETCDHCFHSIEGAGSFADEMVLYCRIRTKDNDPYK